MKLLLLFFYILIAALAWAQGRDEAAIRETVWHYIEGRNNGDSVRLKKAFHADALLKFVSNTGDLTSWKAPDYIRNMSTGRKQDCTGEILEVKSFGEAAQATVILKYPAHTYYDYLNLLKVQGRWVISDKIFARKPAAQKVLFVVSSHSQLGNTGKQAGVNFKEVSYVYKALTEAGYEIDFVSPGGRVTHLYGYDLSDSVNVWFLQQKPAFERLMQTMKPEAVKPEHYKGVYFAGGHGTMWDFPENRQLMTIAASIYEARGVVGALCHGPAGLLNITLSNGELLVKGKRISGFTDAEEMDNKLEKVVPFLLETELKKRGALFQGAAKWSSHVEVDSRLITGQNPQSAAPFAKAFLEELVKSGK